ncbi:MAG: beta-glucosidase [Bryobacteraceae bacterium]
MKTLTTRRAFVLGAASLPALLEKRVEDLLGRLTLEEKAALCHGNVTKDRVNLFRAGGVPRLNIAQIRMLDGRQGIRPLEEGVQTTSLPCTLALSCTWDPGAASTFGRVLADELLAMGQHVLLAPCMNLMRSPLGGRNFENLGEDPLLAGLMASAYIRGVQNAGVAACSAILVANDFEARRHSTSSNLDDRTLREIHLLPFELSITEGRVWTMMTANSLLNGVHNAAHRRLVQGIVKDELGFDGVMLTDWRAAYDTVPTALAGTDMVTGFCAYVFGDGRLLAAVKSGQVPESLVDEKVRRILRLYVRTGVLDPQKRLKGEVETPRHRGLARSLAAEGMVLLKNDRGLLPLHKVRRVLACGPAAVTVPFGGGSGAVRPPFQITPLEGIRNALGEAVEHVPWIEGGGEALFAVAARPGPVLFFAQDPKHGEGNDRTTLDLPFGQARAIARLAEINRDVIVVLLSGGAVSVEPWVDRVPAILAAWYAGQSTGDAVADVLTGKTNPGGKLSFTFGKRLEDYACHALGLWPPRLVLEKPPAAPGFAPEERKATYAYAADYKEGVFMGYRWFDEKGIEPRFPFGHGLSYTTFELSGLNVRKPLRVACTVKNTGGRAGAEVVQVYVAPPKGSVPRPPQELKGFLKVSLKPGESRRVEIPLRPSAFAFFDAGAGKWRAEAGRYEIRVGTSSREIRLRAPVDAAARTFERF